MAGAAQQRRAGTAPGERMGSQRGGIERGISTEGVLPGKLRVHAVLRHYAGCWSARIKPPLPDGGC